MKPGHRTVPRLACAQPPSSGFPARANLPLKGYAQNQVWCEITSLACVIYLH